MRQPFLITFMPQLGNNGHLIINTHAGLWAEWPSLWNPKRRLPAGWPCTCSCLGQPWLRCRWPDPRGSLRTFGPRPGWVDPGRSSWFPEAGFRRRRRRAWTVRCPPRPSEPSACFRTISVLFKFLRKKNWGYFHLSLFLTGAVGQRPRNYSSCCCCFCFCSFLFVSLPL